MQVNYACTVLWATLDAEAPAAWNTYGPATIELITDQFSALLLVGVSMLQPRSASNNDHLSAALLGLPCLISKTFDLSKWHRNLESLNTSSECAS